MVVSYPDPYSRSCRWITSPLRGKRCSGCNPSAAAGIRVWVRDYVLNTAIFDTRPLSFLSRANSFSGRANSSCHLSGGSRIWEGGEHNRRCGYGWGRVVGGATPGRVRGGGTPPAQLGGMGERCMLPHGGLGRSPRSFAFRHQNSYSTQAFAAIYFVDKRYVIRKIEMIA